ncbi:MAG TPA: type III-A CRISPR-associated RAMP protein Csm5, partial [Thermococcus sp.]|nr:type III-A CRISPR-associated RAMP protein Csm5 [Thermococcus sp.]
KKADDLLEAIVFGMKPEGHSGVGYEPKRDPLRALIVRDSLEIGRKHLALYRVDVVGNPQPIPIWVEGLEPGTTTEVEITVDRELLKLNGNEFNGLLWECLRERGEPWKAFEDFLWDAVNEFYSDVIREELKETGKFGKWAKDVRVFYSSLGNYGGHLLRLGWGSGWPSTTIGILLRKERKWERARKMLGLGRKPGGEGFSREFPKTRRIAGGMPMGWVVLE